MKKLSSLLFNQGGKCFYCDAVLDIDEATIDHVVPKSKGGSDDLNNLVVCCKYANQAFRDYSPKHKMTVIRQLCCCKSICNKIFPRVEPTIVKETVVNVPLKPAEPQQSLPINIKKNKLDISIAYSLLRQAIDFFKNEGKETVSSQLKKKMLELEPSFKESDYGFSKFKDFLLHAQEAKIVILKQHKTAKNYIVSKVE